MNTALPESAELAALFAPARQARAALLAVSGGPDSMALLRLAALWRDSGAAPPLQVATVDHCLRAESATEAAQVARSAAAVGLPHATLVWTDKKPATRLQEAARKARYRLLAAHARDRGADMLMLAHHQDDQAETVLFRLLRGSGIDGLSGMESLAEIGPLTLFRPFLGWPKARLVAICAELGQACIDDPSNHDPRFARTRLRALAPLLAARGLDAAALARLAARAARARAALNARAADIARELAPEGAGAPGGVDANALREQPEEIVLRVLAMLLAGAVDNAPTMRLDRLEQLTRRLIRSLRAGVPLSATLAGARVRLDANRRLRVLAEGTRRRGLGQPRRPSPEFQEEPA